MPFDGNGNFVRLHNWTSDAANAIDINAGEMDGEDNGFASGLSNAVTRDGQGKMTTDFLPATDNLYNLGSALKRWASINGTPIGQLPLFYSQTAAESAAGVTPIVLSAPPGAFSRYGVSSSNTDNGPAINNALKCNAIVYDDFVGGSVLYAFQTQIVLQFAGQILRGRGFGDNNTTAVTAPRTTLKWTGSAGATGITVYNGTLNLSETQLYDFCLDGNSLLSIGLEGYSQAVTTGSWRNQHKRLSIINCNNPGPTITLTGAPSGTAGTLTAGWTGVDGWYPVKFSDGQKHAALLRNGNTAILWKLPITGSPTASATVMSAAGVWLGNGVVNANSNEQTTESIYVYNCSIGLRGAGATTNPQRFSVDACDMGMTFTAGAIVAIDRCAFFASLTCDLAAYNIQSLADYGSCFQNSAQGCFVAGGAAAFQLFGSTLHTACASYLMDLGSAAGNGIIKGFLQTGSGSALVTGTNPNSVYDFTGTNITTDGGWIKRVQGVYERADQGACFYSLTSDLTNATGDGTVVSLNASAVTKVYDLATSVNASTGLFTAQITGLHKFNIRQTLANLGAAHTDVLLQLVVTGTSAQTYEVGWRGSPGAARDAANTLCITDTLVVPMTVGDTAYLTILVSGSTKTVTVTGGGSGTNYRSRIQVVFSP